MIKFLRKSIHQLIPAHFNNPADLFVRILKSGSPEGLYAVKLAFLGMLSTPLDYILQLYEKDAYTQAKPIYHPIIFVVGPPRSGTTVVAQTLIKHLPVAYFNNLTSLFPRSPITANTLIPWCMDKDKINYSSFYGKSYSLSGPNDALYLWDRWFGMDRTKYDQTLSEEKIEELRRFFWAYLYSSKKPLVAKNNNLLLAADQVVNALQNSWIICLTRDPLYLAQALLIARRQIHGDEKVAYGIAPQGDKPADPLESVCRQAGFFKKTISDQLTKIGAERFWVVPYEQFCLDPSSLIRSVSNEILQVPCDVKIPPFHYSAEKRLSDAEFARMKELLGKF